MISICRHLRLAVHAQFALGCQSPHTAEYAGSVAPPAGDLPDDPDDAGLLLRQLCRESVESLTGWDLGQFGSGVGFVSIDGLGEPMINDIRCSASTETEGSLVGAISEIGHEAALQFDIIADQGPAAILVESGLSADPATFPGEKTWTAVDRRTVTCDATPA